MDKALKAYRFWKSKHRRSVGNYILINVAIFVMLASTAVLNLFALKWGNSDGLIKVMFITMAISGATGASLTAFIGLLNYKTRASVAQNKIILIQEQWNQFVNRKVGVYDQEDERHTNLLNNVTDILNKD